MAQAGENLAMAQPGSNLWGQTFMRRHDSINIAIGAGDYTYTSERRDAQPQHFTEVMGYFHVGNEFPGCEDRSQWEKSHIRNSNFGRDIFHCIHSQNF